VLVLVLLLLALPSTAAAQGGRAWSYGSDAGTNDSALQYGGALPSIACPDTTNCTAIDSAGNEVTFNPTGAGHPTMANVLRDPDANPLEAVACPSLSQCTATDTDGFEVTFDPADAGSSQTVKLPQGMNALSCPSTTECVGVAGPGYTVFDPQAPGDAVFRSISPAGGGALDSVSCVSVTRCVAETGEGDAIAFDPENPGSTSVTNEVPAGADVVSCVSSGACVAVSQSGDTARFTASNLAASATGNLSDPNIAAASCVSAALCVATDSLGNEITFNPQSVGTPTAIGTGLEDPQAIVCVSTTQCTSVDANGHAGTFNPSAGTVDTPVLVDTSPRAFAIACAGESQCTTVTASYAATFDPLTGAAKVISPNGNSVVACPADTECVGILGGLGAIARVFNPQSTAAGTEAFSDGSSTTPSVGVACPSATQCTAVDQNGEITFNPQDPGMPTPVSLGSAPVAVACPGTTQCTAIDDKGAEATFNPQAPGSPAMKNVDSDAGTTAVACPSLTQCTIVDSSGGVATFDPQAPSAVTATPIDTVSYSDVDASGTNGIGTTSEGGDLVAISCPSTTDCVAVDPAGNALEGNPDGTGAWSSVSLPGMASLVAVTCSDAAVCVAVDVNGDVSVGRLAPSIETVPTISGSDVPGQTLTEAHGAWTSPPTSYAYQWFDCDANGQNCVAIAGATGQTYTLASADVGHTIVVAETATNSGGTSAAASSAATAVVTVPGAGSSGGGTSSGGPGAGNQTTATALLRTRILAALKSTLTGLKGKDAVLRAILEHHGFAYRFTAPAAGTLTIDWYVKVKRRVKLVASVKVVFQRAKTETATVKLTKLGRSRLKARKLTIEQKGSFVVAHSPAVTLTHTETLK
jgi:hypothetical protein